ncbi:MAG: ACP phosphodiesterase, partial [Verrucomicrobiota bacterium]
VIERMIEEGWLREYATRDGIDRTIARVSNRAPFLTSLREAAEVLFHSLERLEEQFLRFYPDLLSEMEVIREVRIPMSRERFG